MKRVILIVLDSVGIGYSKDANLYNDVGANTVGNILNTYNDAKFPNLKFFRTILNGLNLTKKSI
jgi:phosphopentomutase